MARASKSRTVVADNSTGESPSQTDPEVLWLRQLAWRKSAPNDLHTACAAGDITTSAYLFRRLWKLRKKQRPLAELIAALPVGGADAAFGATSGHTFLRNGSGSRSQRLRPPRTFNSGGDLNGNGETASPEQIANAFVTLRLSGRSLNDAELVRMAWQTLRSAGDAASAAVPDAAGLHGLVLKAELPVLQAATFPDLKGSRKLLQNGRTEFRRWLASELDEHGNVHAAWLKDVPQIVASFARATLFARLAGDELWDRPDQRRIVQMVQSLLSLGSPGRLAFSPGDPDALETLLTGVLGLGVLDRNHSIVAQLSDWANSDPGKEKSAKSRAPKRRRSWTLPEESWQSDDAGWASMRTDWNSPADFAQVRFNVPLPELDVVLQDRPLLSGPWEVRWRIGNKAVAVTQPWNCECWFSDPDIDYLELTQKFEKPSRMLVRQIILGKQEGCLVLVDSIRCPGEKEIECEITLPVRKGFGWEQDSMTRESALAKSGLRARLFPLAQPQSKLKRTRGRLWFEEDRLKLSQAADADGLYVPLVIEWDPDRTRLPADWTQLTVAESGRKLTGGEAVGYRLRIGKDQWMLFHQLRPSKLPRSVLGVHTLNETLFTRIDSDGDPNELLLVEAPED